MARRRRIKPVSVAPSGEVVSAAPFIGLCLIATAFFLYAASVLLAPWPVVILGLGIWACLLTLSLQWWTPHPDRLPWLGGAALAFWGVLMIGGGVVFGWHGIWTVHSS